MDLQLLLEQRGFDAFVNANIFSIITNYLNDYTLNYE